MPILTSQAQTPRPERLEACRDALLAVAESYDLDSGPGGGGGSMDWIHCASERSVYSLGAAAYSVADSRWRMARGAASFRAGEGAWLAADVGAGSGDGVAGAFDYFTVRAGLTVKARGDFFVRAEDQYLRIGPDSGHVVKLAAIVQPLAALLAEINASRSVGGNLGTRNVGGRVDWVEARWRGFAGYARGRTTPQVLDVVTGARFPDTKSRQAFAGAFVAMGDAEIGIAFDELRTPATRRRTLAASLRWALP